MTLKEKPSLPWMIADDRELIEARFRMMAIARTMRAPTTGESPEEILAKCERSFLEFLPWWQFKNRDSGESASFANLWTGQVRAARAMMGDWQWFEENVPLDQQRWHEVLEDGTIVPPISEIIKTRAPDYPHGPWCFLLKAGKLGFTELECAYDAWVARFRSQNARVHIFSRDLLAAKEVLRIVRYGIRHLPPWFGIHIQEGEADSNTTTSLRFVMGPDDERTIKSYATGENISIDMVAHHVHLDEWAHMKARKAIWEDIQTTVAPGGTLHIVTRGAGDDQTVRETWAAAERGDHALVPVFAPWHWRDDRDQGWRDMQAITNTATGLSHFAPEQPEDALAGDAENDFLGLVVWDNCHDLYLPPLIPDPRGDPLVLALDAAISGDSFAAVAASRHPDHGIPDGLPPDEAVRAACGRRHEDPAIRAVKVWRPQDFGGRINFATVEGWIRVVCQGGCPGDGRIEAHPLYEPWGRREDCQACQAGATVPPHNVMKVVYDPYQLEDMMQRFRNDGVVTVGPFEQGKARLISDSGLRTLAIMRRLAHTGDPLLREHVGNAAAKVQPAEDSKIRIVKKDPGRRVDAAVAAAMAVDEVLRLLL